jgi:hypothetical protein
MYSNNLWKIVYFILQPMFLTPKHFANRNTYVSTISENYAYPLPMFLELFVPNVLENVLELLEYELARLINLFRDQASKQE